MVRVSLSSPVIDRLKPRTAGLFALVMSHLRFQPALLDAFVAHHKTFWEHGFIQQYIDSLIPRKRKKRV